MERLFVWLCGAAFAVFVAVAYAQLLNAALVAGMTVTK